MNLISGFAGATLTEDGFMKGQMGWGVAEDREDELRTDENVANR